MSRLLLALSSSRVSSRTEELDSSGQGRGIGPDGVGKRSMFDDVRGSFEWRVEGYDMNER